MELVKQDFHHPYKPYDIQYQLMKVIYECIAEEKIGIFESPTGLPVPNSIIFLLPSNTVFQAL